MARASNTTLTALILLSFGLGGCELASKRLSDSDVASFAVTLNQAAQVADEPPEGRLDIHDAVARAIKYNASIRAEELATALAWAKVNAANVSMLPSLVADSRYYGRSEPALSRSTTSSVYSTSSAATGLASELKLSWNILDFGIAYIRSEQAADKADKQFEESRRITTKVIEETRSAYWRSVAFNHLTTRLERLRPDIKRMLDTSKQASLDEAIDPLITINYQRDILNLQRELNQLHTSLAGSEARLRQLTGLSQTAPLRLKPPRTGSPASSLIGLPEDDVMSALNNRYEIRQLMLDLRITDREVNATILQLLPGISLARGLASDSNSFLLHANWTTWGAQFAWNLINLAHLPRQIDVLDAQMQVYRQQAVALAATIAMQVYVARAQIEAQRKAFRDTVVFAAIQNKMLKQVKAAAAVGTVAPQALVKEQLATLLADVRARLAQADLEGAEAAYAASISRDLPASIEIQNSPVAALAEALRAGAQTSWRPQHRMLQMTDSGG